MLRARALTLLPLAVAVATTVAGGVCAKPSARAREVPSAPQSAHLKVVRVYPHDPAAFTQGLLFLDGRLYESTGLFGRSTIRKVDLASGQVEVEAKLPSELFGEGLALVGQRLFQLTWKNQKVLVWDLATLGKQTEVRYEGEGWGLCFDGKRLIMSDGSARLAFRDTTSFAKTGDIEVRMAGRPLANLNELECMAGAVYANVWQDTHIARIDPVSGAVTLWIDASGLLSPEEAAGADVLNGIAELPGTGHLLVTGKLWPHVYEVEIVHDKS